MIPHGAWWICPTTGAPRGPSRADYGSGNGYAPGGIGWYRKHFTLASDLAGKIATIEFDGVYDHAEVWVNGHFVCGRPYGYSSFECPLTPHVRFGTADNVVSVRVDHSRFADSRWYTGSGIYRHVRLRVTDPLRIAHWGTFVTTPAVTAEAATVRVETEIATTAKTSPDRARAIMLESEILLDGQVVARLSTPATMSADNRITVQNLTIATPRRWTLDSPTLYTLRQRLRADSVVTDDAETTFGMRTIRFDPERGFFLNDQPVKLKGVCVHHDAGSLGAAVPAGVWERRLRALKDLGVNAIRTSHNPPAPEFLDLCDRLGLLVKDEAFDEFTPTKNKWVNGWNAGVPSRFGYGEVFKEWSVTDAGDMVRRDRNHPSIIAWSIGNEVDYPNDPFSHPVLADELSAAEPARREPRDAGAAARRGGPGTRCDETRDDGAGQRRDVRCRRPPRAARHRRLQLPGGAIRGGSRARSRRASSSAARTATRTPTGRSCATTRTSPASFSGPGSITSARPASFPTARTALACSTCAGSKKPMAWFRQSLWSDTPMVYLAASAVPAAPAAGAGAGTGAPRRAGPVEEHWNWPAGSTIAVSSYTNAEEVTLTLNDQPLGTKPMAGVADGVLRWDVPYQPGVLKAVARTKGQAVAEFTLTTAGEAARVELIADVTRVAANGEDVVHIEYRVVDRNGVRVPNANAETTFAVEGPARVLGIGNGDLNDATSGLGLVHRAYQGRGLAILQSTGAPGAITVRASSPGLEPATITVTAVARVK